MNTKIHTLEIYNFKSIKELKLATKRINLFIGRPNTGKSNILEALSLFNLDEVREDDDFKKLVRYEKISDFFHTQDMNQSIRVLTNVKDVHLKHFQVGKRTGVVIATEMFRSALRIFDEAKNISEVERNFNKSLRNPIQIGGRAGDVISVLEGRQITMSRIKPYQFKRPQFDDSQLGSGELLSPNGENIFTVLELHPELRKEVAGFFKEYELEFVMNKSEREILIQQRLDNEVIQYPYSTIADTLQRIIFYLAAVKTNRDSVIVLEEPEAHSYPPYTQILARAIAESKENQFFIATHSPYLLDTIIEECTQDEVAVFITTFENFETKIYPQDDLGEVLDYGASIFHNLEKLIAKTSFA